METYDEAAFYDMSHMEKLYDKLLLKQEMDKTMMQMFSTRRLPIEETVWWPYSRARRIQLSELQQRHCWYPGVKYKKLRVKFDGAKAMWRAMNQTANLFALLPKKNWGN